jgi:hypothetical protein
MARILLVEPDYQNKYPPIGLMKLSTFHKERGDYVEFYKGEAPYIKISKFDRIYISTLFTFYYDISVKCIRHYKKFIDPNNIFVGGIAATLLTSDFEKDTGINQIIRGQLVDSRILNYKERINIDQLSLDYDILDDINYKYPSGDNYFVYTTRGCKRGCEFCAVRILEPNYETTNNILNQVNRVDAIYGKKRNLLIMDNNILYSDKLDEIINDIRLLGFNGKSEYYHPNPFVIMMNKIRRRKKYKLSYTKQIDEIIFYINSFASRIKHYDKRYKYYLDIIQGIDCEHDAWSILKKKENEIASFIDRYRSKAKMIRYVDFNQGIDSRLINEKNIELLSSIPIRPFRLAYDNINETRTFINSTKMALKHNIKYFSNYMLFNWEDRPKDLWRRLHIAIKIYNNANKKIEAFSFPMKYAPINARDRKFIGKHWNKKYLSAINIIINVTKGVVVKEIDFFYEAFGTNVNDFLMILNMPDEFIRHRHYFRDNGLLKYWNDLYSDLSLNEKKYLLKILCEAKDNKNIFIKNHPNKISKILALYRINKNQFDKGEKSVSLIKTEIRKINNIPIHTQAALL